MEQLIVVAVVIAAIVALPSIVRLCARLSAPIVEKPEPEPVVEVLLVVVTPEEQRAMDTHTWEGSTVSFQCLACKTWDDEPGAVRPCPASQSATGDA